jgi:hypothetical protein
MLDPWVTNHLALHDRGFNRPGREHDAAVFCRQVAQEDHANARFWLAEASQWERWAGERRAVPGDVAATTTDEDLAWLEGDE